MSDATATIERHEVGDYGEGIPWEVQYDYVIDHNEWNLCPHVTNVSREAHEPGKPLRDDPPRNWMVTRFTVPRLVVAYNEGGYAATGVCLDCILDQYGLKRD